MSVFAGRFFRVVYFSFFVVLGSIVVFYRVGDRGFERYIYLFWYVEGSYVLFSGDKGFYSYRSY